MLHIPVAGNWDYWGIVVTLASIVFILAVLGIIAALFDRRNLIRFTGWATLVVIIFTLATVYFKVNHYFSFIPFKKLAAAASGMIHYRWSGWILMLIGSILMITGGRKKRIEPDVEVV